MGFESFGISLEGGISTADEVLRTIEGLDGVSYDEGSIAMKGSTYLLQKDGRHVIEMELMDTPPWLSCRFTLCHPPSVDTAFLGLVRNLMEKLNMRVRIRDDVTPEDARLYSMEQFDQFAEACVRYIAARRREWKLTFGNQQLAATTVEAHQQIILPQCVPIIDKAG